MSDEHETGPAPGEDLEQTDGDVMPLDGSDVTEVYELPEELEDGDGVSASADAEAYGGDEGETTDSEEAAGGDSDEEGEVEGGPQGLRGDRGARTR